VDSMPPSRSEAPVLWILRGTIRADGTRPHAIAGLSVEPYDHARGINGDVLRGIHYGAILDAALAHARERPGILKILARPGWEIPEAEIAAAELFAGSAPEATTPRRGRPSRPISYYIRVAERAVELFDRDRLGRRTLYEQLAREFHVEYDTARDYVTRLRKQEWLAPAAPGRLTIAPGKKLLEHRHLRKQTAKTKED
jgi:hypothetical protein